MLSDIVRMALAEDAPWGDVTTRMTVPREAWISADLVLREPAVVSGTEVVTAVFDACGGTTKVAFESSDGDALDGGSLIASLEGPAHEVLLGERVCLNLLSHLCGVATATAMFVATIEGTGARIVDTRKTTPGLRELERSAVRDGGGFNHRFGLSDAVLVKDNHIAAMGGMDTLSGLREHLGHMMGLEIEIDSLDQLDAALDAGCDSVLCDNFSLDDLRQAVERTGDAAFVNASGGVDLETVRAIAETGVDLISVGSITHSARSIDIGLDARPQ